jgi:hypothetical protein
LEKFIKIIYYTGIPYPVGFSVHQEGISGYGNIKRVSEKGGHTEDTCFIYQTTEKTSYRLVS